MRQTLPKALSGSGSLSQHNEQSSSFPGCLCMASSFSCSRGFWVGRVLVSSVLGTSREMPRNKHTAQGACAGHSEQNPTVHPNTSPELATASLQHCRLSLEQFCSLQTKLRADSEPEPEGHGCCSTGFFLTTNTSAHTLLLPRHTHGPFIPGKPPQHGSHSSTCPCGQLRGWAPTTKQARPGEMGEMGS